MTSFRELRLVARAARRALRRAGLRDEQALDERSWDAASDALMTLGVPGRKTEAWAARTATWRWLDELRKEVPCQLDFDPRDPASGWSAHQLLEDLFPRDPELGFAVGVLLRGSDPVEVALGLGVTARWAGTALPLVRRAVRRELEARDLDLRRTNDDR